MNKNALIKIGLLVVCAIAALWGIKNAGFVNGALTLIGIAIVFGGVHFYSKFGPKLNVGTPTEGVPVGCDAEVIAVIDKELSAFSGKTRGERMTKWVEEIFADHEDPLLRGDIEAHARTQYPVPKFQMLFTRMPADLVRSVVIHGRTIAGEQMRVMAPLCLSREHIVNAYDEAVVSSARFNLYKGNSWLLSGGAMALLAIGVMTYLNAGWIQISLCVASILMSLFAGTKHDEAERKLASISAALRPCNINMVIHRVVNTRGDLLVPSKDSVGPYKADLDRIHDSLEQWNKQIEIAMKDPFKLIEFGRARGNALFRNDITAYKQGQAVVSSADDLARGGLFYDGPTGSGKSFAFLNGFMGQCMDPEVMFSDDAVEAAMAAKDNSQAGVSFAPTVA